MGHSFQRWANITATAETICTIIFSLPRSLASMVKPSVAAMDRRPLTRNSRPMITMAIHQGNEGGGNQKLVSQGIEQDADSCDLAALAGEISIDAVGHRRDDEYRRSQQLFFSIDTAEMIPTENP